MKAGKRNAEGGGDDKVAAKVIVAEHSKLMMQESRSLLEGAVALAKLVKSGSGGTEEKIEDLVFRCLVREARPIEQRVLGGLYSRNLARYEKDLGAAKELTGSEDAELAAWTLVINVLMNTDEFLTLE